MGLVHHHINKHGLDDHMGYVTQREQESVGTEHDRHDTPARVIMQDSLGETVVRSTFEELVVVSAKDTTSIHSEETEMQEVKPNVHWESGNEGKEPMVMGTARHSGRYRSSKAFKMRLRGGVQIPMNKINFLCWNARGIGNSLFAG